MPLSPNLDTLGFCPKLRPTYPTPFHYSIISSTYQKTFSKTKRPMGHIAHMSNLPLGAEGWNLQCVTTERSEVNLRHPPIPVNDHSFINKKIRYINHI